MGSKIRKLLGRPVGKAGPSTGRRRRIDKRAESGNVWLFPSNEAVSPENDVVERTLTFSHPPAKVWDSLTEKSKVSLWLHPIDRDIEPVVGHRFAFLPRESGDAARIDCEVVTVERERHLSYTWRPVDEDRPSRVSWTLEPIDGGTLVRLRHDAAIPSRSLLMLSAALKSGNMPASTRLRRGRRKGTPRREELLCQ